MKSAGEKEGCLSQTLKTAILLPLPVLGGVIKHVIELTVIVWLSVSETLPALLFNPPSVSRSRASDLHLRLALSFSHFVILGLCELPFSTV